MVLEQLEVLVRFLVGVHINGRYRDSLQTVAYFYLCSPWRFWFDGVTSIPLTWVDYEVYQVWQGQQGWGFAGRLTKPRCG